MNEKLDKLLKKGLTEKKASSDYLMTVADLYENYTLKNTLSYVIPHITSGIDAAKEIEKYTPEEQKKIRENITPEREGALLEWIASKLEFL